MKKFLIIIGLIFIIALCLRPMLEINDDHPACAQSEAQPKITFTGGPGNNPDNAVVISGAGNSVAGIAAEYKYLRSKFGRENSDWMLTRQSVLNHHGKVFDRMDLDMQDGSKKTVFFDISEFFGKF